MSTSPPVDRFPACLAFTLPAEGGWANVAGDPGGDTMQGITLATFRAWRRNPYATPAQLRAMLPAERNAIYGALYWQACRCQDMPAGPDLMVFDEAVNTSPRESAMLLQATLGVLSDGRIGPETLNRLNTRHDIGALINALAVRQEAFYASLSGYRQFGAGWMTRLRHRQATALHMAGATAAAVPLAEPPPPASDDGATDALNAAELARN